MLVENLNLSNVLEQIENDKRWIHDVAVSPARTYSREAQDKAALLRIWLIEHSRMTHDLRQYIERREKLLDLIKAGQPQEADPMQISMFDNY